MAKKKAKKKASKKTDVLPHNDNLPAIMSFEDDSGGGMENIDGDCLAIPYMQILQSGSPQVDEEGERYLDGAKVGMFHHTISDCLFERLVIVPCYFERIFNEWTPRDSGGGFKGRYTVGQVKEMGNTLERDESGKLWLPSGDTYLADTRNHYCLLIDEETGDIDRVIISMSSTQLKKSRKWLSQMNGIKFPKAKGEGSYNPPTYSHKYEMTTEREENAEGKWRGWHVSMIGVLGKDEAHIYEAAKSFHDLVLEGGARAADPAAMDDETDDPDM